MKIYLPTIVRKDASNKRHWVKIYFV